ncbi:NUDIX domain [Cordyceps militaris]|uniref:NUDIX domain n=1 Tax=Cordyceps militaris TaxID=73501 RepID=A0A2H4SF40_CORMI|nr:NUDIX domain [Cordyceps militaris]
MAAPSYDYSFDASLAAFNISKAAFLAAHPHIARIMAAAMVFRPSSPPRTLLLCRAATDTYPLKWEVPGGSVDAADATILDGVARELFEESGLTATRLAAPILMSPEEPLPEPVRAGLGIQPQHETLGHEGLTVTFVESRNLWAKLTALVTVRADDEVRLTPEEHGEAAWVSEDEVRRAVLPPKEEGEGERKLDFVSDGVRRSILDGFRVYAESVAKESNQA